MNGILIAAQIERIATRKDRTVAVTIGTQELSPDKAGHLFQIQDRVVVVYISEKETIPQAEIDKVDALNPEFGQKTQSQRMRNVLYKLFEKSNEGFKDFDSFYHHHTEAIITHLKKKIDA